MSSYNCCFLTWVWGSVYWIYFTLWIYIKLCAYNTCPFVIFNEVKEILGRTTEHYLNSIVKSRDITLSTKVRLVKAMVFPVVMYGCESWTIKKAEHLRIDAFELWCWRRLFESPLDCKEIQPVHPKGNQSWIFIGKTDAEVETPILWLPDSKNWLLGRDPDAGKRLKVGGEGNNRGWDVWMAYQHDGHEFE